MTEKPTNLEKTIQAIGEDVKAIIRGQDELKQLFGANSNATQAQQKQLTELNKAADALKDNLRTLKITVPAKPDAKFNRINADVELSEEFQNNLCLLIAADGIKQVQCGADLAFQCGAAEQTFYLVKFADEPAAAAVLRASDIEREENLPRLTYLYVAKYLTEKYLPAVRAKFPTAIVNNSGIFSGAQNSLTAQPFLLPDGTHLFQVPERQQAMPEIWNLQRKIQNGEIDPSSAKDFA